MTAGKISVEVLHGNRIYRCQGCGKPTEEWTPTCKCGCPDRTVYVPAAFLDCQGVVVVGPKTLAPVIPKEQP